jgi:hypothetical protein
MPVLNIGKFSISPATGILCVMEAILADQIRTRGRRRASRFYVEGGGAVLANAGGTWYTAVNRRICCSAARTGAVRPDRLKTLLKI